MRNTQKGFIVPLLIVIIAVLVIAGGVYVFEQSKPQSADWDTFTSSKYNFQISYPKTFGAYIYNKDTLDIVEATSTVDFGKYPGASSYSWIAIAKSSAVEAENAKKESYPFVTGSVYIQISNGPASIGPNGVTPMSLEAYESNTKSQYEDHNAQAIQANRPDLVEKPTFSTLVINNQPAFEETTDLLDRVAFFNNNNLYLLDIGQTSPNSISQDDFQQLKNIVKTFKFTLADNGTATSSTTQPIPNVISSPTTASVNVKKVTQIQTQIQTPVTLSPKQTYLNAIVEFTKAKTYDQYVQVIYKYYSSDRVQWAKNNPLTSSQNQQLFMQGVQDDTQSQNITDVKESISGSSAQLVVYTNIHNNAIWDVAMTLESTGWKFTKLIMRNPVLEIDRPKDQEVLKLGSMYLVSWTGNPNDKYLVQLVNESNQGEGGLTADYQNGTQVFWHVGDILMPSSKGILNQTASLGTKYKISVQDWQTGAIVYSGVFTISN